MKLRRVTLRLVTPVLALSLLFGPMRPAAGATAPVSILTSRQVDLLAPGATLTTFDWLYPAGWVRGYLLEADLTQPGLRTDLVTAPAVTSAQRLSEFAGRAGAIAAINGDFFDINNTKLPLGAEVQNGQLLKSSPPNWNAAGVGKDRIGRLLQVALAGTVTLPTGAHPLTNLNQYTVADDGIGLYTPLWTATRQGAAFGAARAREVILRGGKVEAISTEIGTTPIGPDMLVLVGREKGADALAGLKVGDRVSVTYAANPDLQFAVGGLAVLVRDGQVQPLDDRKTGPRSAIGFSADGRRIYLLAVDGRSEESGGLTLHQLAAMMQSFGAASALELDGGGSTTMVARTQPTGALSLVNAPSDGEERRIPNGVGIFSAPGSGKPARLSLSAATGTERAFPGLTRRLTARAYDETHAPVQPGTITWRSSDSAVGTLDQAGLFTGRLAGKVTVQAEAGGVSGELTMTVLGGLDRLEADTTGLRLQPGQSALIRVTGFDREGYAAPLEPADLRLTYDQALLKVEPTADGALRATSLKAGTGLVTLEAQGKRVTVPFGSGTVTRQVDAFSWLGAWRFSKIPTTVGGALTQVQGYQGKGLKLTYTFGDGATRAAYADAAPALRLPGTPERFGLWINGDNKGAWLRAVVTDGLGRPHTLELVRQVNWTGWRRVEVSLPPTVTYPVSLTRIYPVETSSSRQYSGALIFSDLQVTGPVALPKVPAAVVTDPILLEAGQPLRAPASRVALVSSEATVRTAVAMGAELLLATPGFAARAEQLSQALGSAAEVRSMRVAPTVDTLDFKGTRFVLLNSSQGGLRATGFQQMLDLQALLDQAATDPAVGRVMVVSNYLPSQFADPRERHLAEGWLGEFRVKSGGKGAAWLAPGSGARVTRAEGVPYVQAGQGMLLGIAPSPVNGEWLEAVRFAEELPVAEVRPIRLIDFSLPW